MDDARRTSTFPVFARGVSEALGEWGFVALSNHGISDSIIRADGAAGRIFEHPDEVLIAWEDPGHVTQRGFRPTGSRKARRAPEGKPDPKRFWQMGPIAKVEGLPENIWPDELDPGFRPAMEDLYRAYRRIEIPVVMALEIYLGYKVGTISEMLDGGNTVMWMVDYLPTTELPPGYEHEDIGMLTFLSGLDLQGLRVKSPSGKWVTVEGGPESVIVNAGDMLAAFTRKTRNPIRSVTHGVEPVHRRRRTFPKFLYPRPGIMVDLARTLTVEDFYRGRHR